MRILSGGREIGDLRRYLISNPLINNELIAGQIVKFKIPGNPTVASGYEATMLVEIYDKYMEAANQELLRQESDEAFCDSNQISSSDHVRRSELSH